MFRNATPQKGTGQNAIWDVTKLKKVTSQIELYLCYIYQCELSYVCIFKAGD